MLVEQWRAGSADRMSIEVANAGVSISPMK